jgi:arginine deiminase
MTTKKWGVANAFGDLKTVLMHRPGSELSVVTHSNLRDFNFDEPVDTDQFRHDYDLMAGLFDDHGVDVLFLTDVLGHDADALNYISHRPNMTYTRDLAHVFGEGAVLMGPKLRGRWGDQHIVGRALARLGIPLHGSIECPAFLEGGGVTMIGDDTIVASICDRANQSGTAALRELVLGTEVEYFLEVPLPFGHIHIDGLFMMLGEKLAICHTESLEVFPCALYEAGVKSPRYLMFAEFLAERDIEVIPITTEEMRRGDLNVVVTQQGRKAIGFSSAARLATEMAARGWELATFPQETLFKGNGGAHCMTCPILVV